MVGVGIRFGLILNFERFEFYGPIRLRFDLG